jgi:malonyl-CoA O-methyltransferase
MTTDLDDGAAALANVEAYDRWAPAYPPAPHNPLMRAEQVAMLALWPAVEGVRALDLGCGTGRYGRLLEARGAACVVGVDRSPEMLRRAPLARRVRADMARLPFGDGQFDLVVSGLAVGHAPSLDEWMREMARVLAPDGHLVCTDFHPAAALAGMTRSFTDEAQHRHTLRHQLFDAAAHREAAAAAGLVVEAVREVRVGIELDEAFEGFDEFYRRWQDLPVVLALRLRKGAP